MRLLAKASLLAFAIVACNLSTVFAQPNIGVTSTNNGSGLFSYTFTLGNTNFAWGFTQNDTAMTMRFHGVQTVFSPVGWASEVDTNDLVTWRYLNNDLVLLGDPSITFAIQSSSTASALYNVFGAPNPDYPRGIVFGTIYEQATRTGFAVGYETFSYVGPAVVPEPSCIALFAAALAGLGYKRFPRRSPVSMRPVRR